MIATMMTPPPRVASCPRVVAAFTTLSLRCSLHHLRCSSTTTTATTLHHLPKRRLSSSSSLSFLHNNFSLCGKSAIVTGGGTGIGAALAMGLARAGCSVVLTGRRTRPLEDSCHQIRQQLHQDKERQIRMPSDGDDEDNDNVGSDVGGSAYYYPCDITNFDRLPDLVMQAESLTGIAPTIIINNAGVNVRQAAADVTEDHWTMSLHLMLSAPAELVRVAAAGMKDQRYGRIVNIASLQSFRAFPNSMPYGAAKSGVLGLTRALAEAYCPAAGYDNVTCNAIAPGYVKTELTAPVFADEERSDRLAAATVLGRNSVPDDLVGPAVFLASPAASYVTGQTLPVDGGFTALGLR